MTTIINFDCVLNFMTEKLWDLCQVNAQMHERRQGQLMCREQATQPYSCGGGGRFYPRLRPTWQKKVYSFPLWHYYY